MIKHLIDEGEKQLNWKRYKITVLTGGEGFIPEWKEYIRKKIGKDRVIISAYGSSDIDIGVAFETFFSAFIRNLAWKNRKLRKALFGFGDKIPMVFQYDPLQYYIHQVERTRPDNTKVNEFEITSLDINIASPKIKYNIHDEGGVYSYEEMLRIIKKEVPDLIQRFKQCEIHNKRVLKLPFLWVNGRSDGTISLDGANIYPHNIDAAIHSDTELNKKTSSFKISVRTTKSGSFKFIISIELKKGYRPNNKMQSHYHDVIVQRLLKLNRDFKESYLKDKKSLEPNITLFGYETGPFKVKNKIKNIYID